MVLVYVDIVLPVMHLHLKLYGCVLSEIKWFIELIMGTLWFVSYRLDRLSHIWETSNYTLFIGYFFSKTPPKKYTFKLFYMMTPSS